MEYGGIDYQLTSQTQTEYGVQYSVLEALLVTIPSVGIHT